MKQAKAFKIYWVITTALTVVLLLSSTIAYAAVKTLINPVVVRVNGEDVSETEFLYFLMGKHGNEIVDKLVEHLLLKQQASQFGLTLNKQDGWDFLEKTYSQEKLNSLGNAFDLDLVATALAREVLAVNVINKKSEQLIKDDNIKVSDDDILQFYLNNIDKLLMPESAGFSWIVMTDRPTAEKALGRLKNGDDFATVAKEISVDELTSKDGGKVGVIAKGETKGLPKEIEDAIFSLSEGHYSDIIEVQNNFIIVMTNEKHDAYEPSLEELKPLIETKLLTTKIEGPLGQWLKQLSDNARIEIVYPIFQEMGEPGKMVPEENGVGQ